MGFDKEIEIKLQEDEIDATANSVFPWVIFARKLLYSCFILDKNSDKTDLIKNSDNVARMLIGMSIECYLKAFYIASGHKIKRDKNNKLETHGSHNLKAMAQKFNFQTSVKERSVLHYLSMYIRVKGRYPVPLQLKDMKIDDATPSNGLGDYVLLWENDYDDVCIQIVTRLENEIKNLRQH